jgi:hypothetical protein
MPLNLQSTNAIATFLEERSKLFLNKWDGYIPFAAVKRVNVTSFETLDVYLGTETPDPKRVVEVLKERIKTGFEANEFSVAGISQDSDVRYKGDTVSKRAIEIKTLDSTSRQINYYINFTKNEEGLYIFDEMTYSVGDFW